MSIWTLVILSLALAQQPPRQGPKFYPDDPIRVDEDSLDTPAQPAEIELSDTFDRFGHIMRDVGSAAWGEAENINTLDEIPDSSWFTNRHRVQRMSIQDLKKGPDTGRGPDPNQIWTILRGKAEGLTPGFTIEDEAGQSYVIKFGARGYPDLNSSSEIIATKLFYAAGYNAPENYIVYMKPENLRVREGTEVTDRFGDKLVYTEKMMRQSLKNLEPEADGTYRIVASRYFDGVPLGPFRYYGRRTDDPNDIFDHEQRRELRGLRLIAAWLNHDDTRAHNSQDVWVEDNGRHYIHHYLIDFGSALGSGTDDLQRPNLSFHYWLEPELITRNALGFGLHVPKYRKVDWSEALQYPNIGRIESEWFDAEEWKNDYPNPAFVRMTERDAFWAAKIIMSFTQEELRAVIETGQLRQPGASDYLLKVLVERQRKCGVFGLNRLNPIDQFEVNAQTLSFVNLSEKYGLGGGGSTYAAQWGVFDNADNSQTEVGTPITTRETSLDIPTLDMSAEQPYLTVTLRTHHADHPAWDREVRVYLRPGSGGFSVVGIDRESTPSLAPEK